MTLFQSRGGALYIDARFSARLSSAQAGDLIRNALAAKIQS